MLIYIYIYIYISQLKGWVVISRGNQSGWLTYHVSVPLLPKCVLKLHSYPHRRPSSCHVKGKARSDCEPKPLNTYKMNQGQFQLLATDKYFGSCPSNFLTCFYLYLPRNLKLRVSCERAVCVSNPRIPQKSPRDTGHGQYSSCSSSDSPIEHTHTCPQLPTGESPLLSSSYCLHNVGGGVNYINFRNSLRSVSCFLLKNEIFHFIENCYTIKNNSEFREFRALDIWGGEYMINLKFQVGIVIYTLNSSALRVRHEDGVFKSSFDYLPKETDAILQCLH